MTIRTLIELVDDVDGTPATQTLSFALDGVSYEIDLADTNAAALREAIAPWASHARRIGGRRRTTTITSTDNHAIRAWAQQQGLEVSPRGRIARTVVEAYQNAHQH